MKELPLSKGYVALIDDADFEVFGQHKWSAIMCSGRPYARRNRDVDGKLKCVLLHREIMEVELGDSGLHVDHRDGNTLNCQRYNLRVATVKQNLGNQRKQNRSTTSRYKGVAWHRQKYGREKWAAYLHRDGKKRHIGMFDREEDAARAYDAAAREAFDEFAKPNFPEAVAR